MAFTIMNLFYTLLVVMWWELDISMVAVRLLFYLWMRGIINSFNSFADINECKERTAQCSLKASCVNTPGSFSCKCIAGYQGDGKNCHDEDECLSRQHCALNADCRNIDGSYTCSCNSGFHGDGFSCYDVDECRGGIHDCHAKAQCRNTWGSYSCSCIKGYHGNGRQCKGKQAVLLRFFLL